MRETEPKLEFDKACNSQRNQSVIALSYKSYETCVRKQQHEEAEETTAKITFALVEASF